MTAGFLAVLGTVLLAHSIIMTDQLAGFASDEAGRLGRLASLWGQPEAGNRWFAEFHSADQYWRFQWTEAGILLVATTLLGCALAYRVARRGAST